MAKSIGFRVVLQIGVGFPLVEPQLISDILCTQIILYFYTEIYFVVEDGLSYFSIFLAARKFNEFRSKGIIFSYFKVSKTSVLFIYPLLYLLICSLI